jgi:hypothetical protein
MPTHPAPGHSELRPPKGRDHQAGALADGEKAEPHVTNSTSTREEKIPGFVGLGSMGMGAALTALRKGTPFDAICARTA